MKLLILACLVLVLATPALGATPTNPVGAAFGKPLYSHVIVQNGYAYQCYDWVFTTRKPKIVMRFYQECFNVGPVTSNQSAPTPRAKPRAKKSAGSALGA